MIRLLIADEHSAYRETLGRALATDPAGDIQVLDTCDPADALEAVARSRVDALLLELPPAHGPVIAQLRALAQRQPSLGVLLLAHHRDDEALLDALLAGALSYVLRSAPARAIAAAARAVARGESPLDPQLTARVVELYQNLTRPMPCAQATATLPPEDLLLLRFITAGLSNKEIAQRVGLAPSTVRNRLTGIFSRLGVSHRTQAALIGVRWGLAPRVRLPLREQPAPLPAPGAR